MDRHLRSSGLRLFSLESRLPLERFDIIGFSLLYELNYTNMLTILDLAGIPFYAAQRDQFFSADYRRGSLYLQSGAGCGFF